MGRIIIRVAAERDLVEQFLYLAENASVEVARRFFAAADETFEKLSEMPMMGTLQHFSKRKYARIRKWRVRGFEKHDIYYRPIRRGIEIARVIHSARDIRQIFH